MINLKINKDTMIILVKTLLNGVYGTANNDIIYTDTDSVNSDLKNEKYYNLNISLDKDAELINSIKFMKRGEGQYNRGYNDALDELAKNIVFMDGDSKTLYDVLKIIINCKIRK